MPIFEYRCTSCNNNFEVLQRTNDQKSDVKCPKCGTLKTKKRLSSFSTTVGQSELPQNTGT
ncbi:zinc ribbon domain-containing protein [Candidatus Poribacteria bacterium]|nr:zinc ribbon domain-containing protein [Candidatus Poribacteria bacterium]